VEVAGREEVTVPAGKFDAWKVELSPAEGGPEKVTYWIDAKTRRFVKSQAAMPQMGGATMTVELE
jgi:hypothetical protein